MARKYLSAIDMSKNEIQNHVLHRLASAPSSPVEGQIYYNTGDDKVYYRNATDWVEFGAAGEPPAMGTDDITNDSNGTGTTASDVLDDHESRIDAMEVIDHTHSNKAVLDATTASFLTADETKLDGIEAAADVTDAVNVAAAIVSVAGKTTPVDADTFPLIDSAASNALKEITLANLKTAIVAGIVDSAPGTLDTLNELAAALGDDPDFVGTVTGLIGGLDTRLDTAESDITAIESAITGVTKKYAATIGDNSDTTLDVTHNLGTKDVVVSVRQVADDVEVYPDVTMTSTNVVTLGFAVAPATNALRVTVIG